jgi:hypothetical protein
MAILRRYGVADAIEFPLIKRAVVDFAVSGDYTPVQSDVRIHIDAASASYATNVLQATGSHGWSLALLASELSGKKISVTVVDAATKAVEDQMILIETYGSPLAQHPFDLSTPTVTLSQPALDAAATQIVNTVWATGSRTLTGLGTGTITADTIADSAASEIATAVWATASRTLSSFGTLQGDIVNNVWATPSRTLSSFGTLQSDIVNNVWATPSRTLSSFGTLQGDVVNAVWATPSRTLSTAGMNSIADVTLRRTYANARASSDGDAVNFRSLLGATGKLVNKVAVSGANLVIFQEDDLTSTAPGGTQAITTDSAAAPITALDTV